jgi:hypothetical protein
MNNSSLQSVGIIQTSTTAPSAGSGPVGAPVGTQIGSTRRTTKKGLRGWLVIAILAILAWKMLND